MTQLLTLTDTTPSDGPCASIAPSSKKLCWQVLRGVATALANAIVVDGQWARANEREHVGSLRWIRGATWRCMHKHKAKEEID
jgi:hypothetical protein